MFIKISCLHDMLVLYFDTQFKTSEQIIRANDMKRRKPVFQF